VKHWVGGELLGVSTWDFQWVHAEHAICSWRLSREDGMRKRLHELLREWHSRDNELKVCTRRLPLSDIKSQVHGVGGGLNMDVGQSRYIGEPEVKHVS
jgi:hypothetical protein